MTAIEQSERTLVTLKVDDLQPGDEIRLVGVCTVLSVERPMLVSQRIVHVRCNGTARETAVWLWKHSRIEVLSDVNGRGHLATPVHANQDAY